MGATTSSGFGKPRGARKPNKPRPQKWRAIDDRFSTMEEVQDALRTNGLESCNLIIGIDFTKSNSWTGKNSFDGRNLHCLEVETNPYEEAVTTITNTLDAFDDDKLIPCYGFGDITTNDRGVFSFRPDDTPCEGLEQVLAKYREMVPQVKLAGPTSFAPIIYRALQIVKESAGGLHILIIVADGQVTRQQDLPPLQRSQQEQETIQAIVDASDFPLSIILVGVGDGPWDKMEEFDDSLPDRAFDNFQFVNFTTIARTYKDPTARGAYFAVQSLMEVPDQFKEMKLNELLGEQVKEKSFQWKEILRNPPGEPPRRPPNLKLKAGESQRQKDMYVCPMSKLIMTDPVIASDGYTYERSAIEEWLTKQKTSPMTKEELAHLNLIPNHNLRSAIMEATTR